MGCETGRCNKTSSPKVISIVTPSCFLQSNKNLRSDLAGHQPSISMSWENLFLFCVHHFVRHYSSFALIWLFFQQSDLALLMHYRNWKLRKFGTTSFFLQSNKNQGDISVIWTLRLLCKQTSVNPLSANPTKGSNTLKQFIGWQPTNCSSVFDYFVGLTLKSLTNLIKGQSVISILYFDNVNSIYIN